MSKRIDLSTQKFVTFPLGLGICFCPYIFSWFTLRKGYSRSVRIITFVWLGLALFAFSCNSYNSTSPSLKANTPEPNPIRQIKVESVQLPTLLAEYANNEIRADGLYKDKMIQIRGIVTSIKKDIINTMYVTLGTGQEFEFMQVQCFFQDKYAQQLTQLNVGNFVTVNGRVDGLMMNILIRDCALVSF